MRRGCGSLTLLVPIVLQACGGGDGPVAPTQMPPPTVTPIVVTITAQVTNNPAAADLRGFQDQGIIEKRNVRVTGEVSVTGGTATVGATVTFTAALDNGIQAFTAEMDALSMRTIAPGTPGTPFTVNIPINSAPGLNASGTVRVDVIGTDERGGMVNVSTELTVTEDNTRLPAGTCVENDTTLCIGPFRIFASQTNNDDRFKVTVDWLDPNGNQGAGIVESRSVTGNSGQFDFPGASGGIVDIFGEGYDVLVRVLNDCGTNNMFSIFMAAGGNIEFTLTVTDTQTNQTREYFNPQGTLPDPFTDTAAFATCP